MMSYFIDSLNELEVDKEVLKKRLNELESIIDKVKELKELGITDTKIPITVDKVSTINKVLKIIYNNESHLDWDKQELIVYEDDYFTTSVIMTIYKIEAGLTLDIHQKSKSIVIDIKNAFSKVVTN